MDRATAWPSGQGAWPPPPWRMTGRMLTGYFEMPWNVLEQVVAKDLLPEYAAAVPSRLRFYRLEAVGHVFHEAVIGTPMRIGALNGEATFLIWSDSETYQTWGREVFGWPVVRAEISLDGGLWARKALVSDGGECRLATNEGRVLLEARGSLTEAVDSDRWIVRAPWLSPRRTLLRGGLDGDFREVMRITPSSRTAGAIYTGTGTVQFSFDEGHPLSSLGDLNVTLELVDGFSFVVGDDVEIVFSARTPVD